MGALRNLAAKHAQSFLAKDFDLPIKLTSPEGIVYQLTGYATEISQGLDPQTGVMVRADKASIAFSILTFLALGGSREKLPYGVAESEKLPWVVEITDIVGEVKTYKVKDSYPDHAIGVQVCILENYGRSH